GEPHALFEVDLWTPTEARCGGADVQAGAALLSGPGRAVACRACHATGGGDEAVDAVDISLGGGADVVAAEPFAVSSPEVGADDVVDVDEVASLQAVAADHGLVSAEQPLGEDGDHTCLAVRILARPVDVAIAQGDELETVEVPVDRAVDLSAELGG